MKTLFAVLALLVVTKSSICIDNWGTGKTVYVSDQMGNIPKIIY